MNDWKKRTFISPAKVRISCFTLVEADRPAYANVGTTRGLSTKEVAPGKRFYMVSLTDSITAKKKTQAPYS